MSGPQVADLLITDAVILDVFSGQLISRPLAICGERILGLGDYPARQVMSLPGKTLLPGFCDGHIHLESSLLTPSEFAANASLHGTTCVVADPHELA
ncbi:MAG: amidohydrolase family protein, partial [Armatimonadota bacterium]